MEDSGEKDVLKTFLNSRGETEKPDVLTRQQINQCLMDVEDIHPMRKTSLEDILPFLKPFRRCMRPPKEDFDHALRTALMKEIGLKMPKSELELIKEPFLRLGYGVNSYFDIMLQIFYLFTFLSFVCLPMFYVYSSANAQGMQEYQKGFKLTLGRFTLGNLGGASVHCETKRIESGFMWDLTCLNA